jgi:hypothetical protein
MPKISHENILKPNCSFAAKWLEDKSQITEKPAVTQILFGEATFRKEKKYGKQQLPERLGNIAQRKDADADAKFEIIQKWKTVQSMQIS